MVERGDYPYLDWFIDHGLKIKNNVLEDIFIEW